MKCKISRSKYKDIDCLIMENGKLAVTVIPESGGKIQSIYDMEKKKEYLWQSPWEQYRRGQYDSLYETGEFSGFDDMFPTVSECFYPSGPWKGTKVPDHGEVWSLPYDSEIRDDSILLSVCGVRFPYRLQKTLSFTGPSTLRIDYAAFNLTGFDFNFIWAAHPLFNCNENMEIVFPKSVKKLINTYSGNNRMGSFGTVNDWPIAVSAAGDRVDMSKIAPENALTCEKYYASERLEEGWCAVHDTKTGEVIGLSYPADKVPYLGMWLNEGGYSGQYNAAPEPCTAPLDRVDTSVQWDRASIIKANGSYEWYLNLTFGSAKQVNYIDEHGGIT